MHCASSILVNRLRDPVRMMSDGEQHEDSEDGPSEAFLHAQEYIELVADAADYAALDQALLLAQGYFQTLLQCSLIEIEVFLALNQQAVAVADAWRPSVP